MVSVVAGTGTSAGGDREVYRVARKAVPVRGRLFLRATRRQGGHRDDEPAVGEALGVLLGGQWSVQPLAASGFCATWQATRGSERLFVKSLPASRQATLEAEADGLAALAATATVRVPAIAAHGLSPDHRTALLALEWLAFGRPPSGFGARLGAALGALHAAQAPSGDRFGWHRDNLLGATPQSNRWSGQGGTAGWIAFFADQRLGALRERLASAGAATVLTDAVDAVIARLPAFFEDGHQPRPSLIHGDLWSGNWGALADGSPVVFDPAVSCSDAEAELAMMELFGTPPDGFWPAYRDAAGVHAGYPRRRPLYQLYHLLNHALLFGGGYRQQALAVARGLPG
jgi:fructosamine-3-kinase